MQKSLNLLFLFFMIFINHGISQSLKSKSYPLKIPSYALLVKPENVTTYAAEVALGAGEILNFTNKELKEKLILEDFMKVNENEEPDLFFAINGISRDDLEVTGTLAPVSGDTYSLQIIPKEKASISLAVIVKGELTHIWDFAIPVKTDVQGNLYPVTINFSKDEKFKYLVSQNGSSFSEISMYTIEQFLNESFGKSFLMGELIPKIKAAYDNTLLKEFIELSYIKDKKNKSITEETKSKLASFEKFYESKIINLQSLRKNKGEFLPYKEYWESLLRNYPNQDKNSKKIRWGLLMNLYAVNLIMEDFTNAELNLNKAKALGIRKSATSTTKDIFHQIYKAYKMNFNEATGEKKFVSTYTKNETAKLISRTSN